MRREKRLVALEFTNNPHLFPGGSTKVSDLSQTEESSIDSPQNPREYGKSYVYSNVGDVLAASGASNDPTDGYRSHEFKPWKVPDCHYSRTSSRCKSSLNAGTPSSSSEVHSQIESEQHPVHRPAECKPGSPIVFTLVVSDGVFHVLSSLGLPIVHSCESG